MRIEFYIGTDQKTDNKSDKFLLVLKLLKEKTYAKREPDNALRLSGLFGRLYFMECIIRSNEKQSG